MKLLSQELNVILSNQDSITSRTEVPNSHPVMTKYRPMLQAIAQGLGVDFEATGFTFTVDVREGGKVVYSPYVALYGAEPTLFWGNTRTPLAALSQKPAVVEAERRAFLEFQVEIEGEQELVQVSMSLTKDAAGKPPSIEEIKKAAVKGKLASVLAAAIVKPKSLGTLEPGSYQVVGYSYDAKFERYSIDLQDADGKSIGVYKANSAIASLLTENPVITPEAPADLEVMVSTKEVNGHPVVPVRFLPAALKAMPAFTF